MNKKGNKGKVNETKVYIAVLVIIFVAAIILSVVRMGDGGEPVTTPSAAPTDAMPTPNSTPNNPDGPEDTPEPTPSVAPVQTPRPTPTPPPPTPTPTPTPTPPPASDLGSGSFSSNTNVGLDLVVDWAAGASGEGAAKVTFSIKLNSYSLYTTSQIGSLVLTVGSDTYYFDTPAVSYDGHTLLTTPFATKSVNVPVGSVNVSAEWFYRGTYSGTYIESITASNTIDIG